jgi:hypothetical protein
VRSAPTATGRPIGHLELARQPVWPDGGIAMTSSLPGIRRRRVASAGGR